MKSKTGIPVDSISLVDEEYFQDDQIRRIHEKRANGLVSVFRIAFDVFQIDPVDGNAECIRVGNIAGYASTRAEAIEMISRFNVNRANINLGVTKKYYYEEMTVTPYEKEMLLNE